MNTKAYHPVVFAVLSKGGLCHIHNNGVQSLILITKFHFLFSFYRLSIGH